MPKEKLIAMEKELRQKALEVGLKYVVTCWDRTPIEQAAIFAQGRCSYETVSLYRSKAGLPLIDKVRAGQKVSWTLDSRHLYGEAFDFALFDKKAKVHYNLKENINGNLIDDYREIAELWRKLGGKPGIDFDDACHLQL